MRNATKRKRDGEYPDDQWTPYPEIEGYEMSPRNTWDLGNRYNAPEDFPDNPIVPVIPSPTGVPAQSPDWQIARYHERIVRNIETKELSRILVDVMASGPIEIPETPTEPKPMVDFSEQVRKWEEENKN